MITYGPLNPRIELGFILHLISDHAKEMYGDDSNLDANHLYTMANVGMVRVFIAKDGNKIIGYNIFLLGRDLFKAHITQAECIALYVKPEYRNLVIANKLMRQAENTLRIKDNTCRIVSTTSIKPGLEAFYKRLGYIVTNVQVTKEL